MPLVMVTKGQKKKRQIKKTKQSQRDQMGHYELKSAKNVDKDARLCIILNSVSYPSVSVLRLWPFAIFQCVLQILIKLIL